VNFGRGNGDHRMNERIKELALESGFFSVETRGTGETKLWAFYGSSIENELQKFAELIVRECADITKTVAPYSSDDLILKRFGFDDGNSASDEDISHGSLV
jgi:hypothetical protein